ncbi:MAG: neutral/alkaline non-lysosomal ceramidase N-terminal domain-containing protein, partial [Actinomycetota bacterium]
MSLQAGFGKSNITPSVPVMLAGFGDRTTAAEEVHDDLEARALYLEEGDVRLCLVVCDLLGMSVEFSGPVRCEVAGAIGADLDAVLTASTHTHSGPNVMKSGESLGWATPEGYEKVLVDGCRTAALAARDTAEAANLFFGRASLSEGLSVNRRGNPYDPWFTVLDLRRTDSSRIGVLANFSIHPVSLGPEWLAVSCDWVGPFRTALESQAGGSAILVSGALGDVNPPEWESYHGPGGMFETTESLGQRIAAEAALVLPDCLPADGPLAVVASRTIEVPVSRTPLADLAGIHDRTEVELVEWSIGGV